MFSQAGENSHHQAAVCAGRVCPGIMQRLKACATLGNVIEDFELSVPTAAERPDTRRARWQRTGRRHQTGCIHDAAVRTAAAVIIAAYPAADTAAVLRKVAAINPATACLALIKMCGFVFWRATDASTDVFAARNVDHGQACGVFGGSLCTSSGHSSSINSRIGSRP
jgi:hypothetical protein